VSLECPRCHHATRVLETVPRPSEGDVRRRRECSPPCRRGGQGPGHSAKDCRLCACRGDDGRPLRFSTLEVPIERLEADEEADADLDQSFDENEADTRATAELDRFVRELDRRAPKKPL
jgi:hypothetical protein